jgi:hypothetical protein
MSLMTESPSTPHDALEQIGLELAAVAVTAVIAGTGPKAAHAMVALWLLLWLVLLVTHYHATGTITQSSTGSGTFKT